VNVFLNLIQLRHNCVRVKLVKQNFIQYFEHLIALSLADATGDSERVVVARVGWAASALRLRCSRCLAIASQRQSNEQKCDLHARILALFWLFLIAFRRIAKRVSAARVGRAVVTMTDCWPRGRPPSRWLLWLRALGFQLLLKRLDQIVFAGQNLPVRSILSKED
jgi:hypothetical protein